MARALMVFLAVFLLASAVFAQLAPSSVFMVGRVQVAGEDLFLEATSMGGYHKGKLFLWPLKRADFGAEFVVRLNCERVDCSSYSPGDWVKAIVRARTPGGLAEFVAWSVEGWTPGTN